MTSIYTFRRVAFAVIVILLHYNSHSQLSTDFTSNITSGCTPLVVQFTDQSTGGPTQWRWELGNGTISFLQNPSTTYFIPGTYNVKLVIRNASGADSIIKNQYITVYPNPVKHILTVKINGNINGQGQLQLAAITGKVLTTYTVDAGEQQIDMSQYSAGVYMLKYADEHGVSTMRVTKE